MNENPTANRFEVLAINDFVKYLISRTSISFAINIFMRVIQLQITYNILKDASTLDTAYALGMMGLAEFFPFLVVVLGAGWVADNFNRRHILYWCLGLYALCAAALLLISSVFSSILANGNLLPIYIIIGLTGLVRGFMTPTQSAFAAQLVPKHLYANAATFTTTSWHLSSILGPALGGFIFAYAGGAITAYAAVVVMALMSFFIFTKISNSYNLEVANDTKTAEKEHISDEKKPRSNFFKDLGEGIKFVFKHQIILGSIALDMFAVLFGGAVALIPLFAKDVLHVGPQEAALLQAAPAVGAMIMSVILIFNPPIKNSGLKLLGAVAAFGLCTIGFGISTNFWLSMLCLAGTGFFDNVSMVVRGTILQIFTPNEMRGRVSAVNSLFIGSSNELGAFESGVAARVMTLVPSILFGGTMTLVVVAIVWILSPRLRGLHLSEHK